MQDNPEQKNGSRFVVVAGSKTPRRRSGRIWTRDDLEIEEQMYAVCRTVVTPTGICPSRAWQWVRDGRQSFWRMWAKRSREAVARGVTEATLVAPTLVFLAWQRSLYRKGMQQQQHEERSRKNVARVA